MKLRNILYITPNYPIPEFPERGAFVDNLLREFLEAGVYSTVISPASIANKMRYYYAKKHEITLAAERIYRPYFMSYSNLKIGPINTGEISRTSFVKACCRPFQYGKIDVAIGKFLLSGGSAAVEISKKLGIPAFADIGESRSFLKLNNDERKASIETLSHLSGMYCVSSRLADELVILGADPSKIIIVPNTVDQSRFFPMDKYICRNHLGLDPRDKIVIFVGHFVERKGPMRVLHAMKKLPSEYRVIFLGQGTQKPSGERVIYAGSVPNSELPQWLNAADIFCLPTLAEGHCNAIEEAKACGLPVVSSNIKSVIEQLKNHTAITVDPQSIDDIGNAIFEFGANPRPRSCATMSSKMKRGERIIQWIESKVNSSKYHFIDDYDGL